jgi:hypothetical protein
MSHGVNITEVPTGVVPPVSVTAGLPVYVGTAPINQGDPTSVNKPVLCATLADYVATFGPIPDSSTWDKWTLAEAASAHFSVFGVGPIVCINVIDPAKSAHVTKHTDEAHTLGSDGTAKLTFFGAVLLTVVVKLTTTGHPAMTLGSDYTLAFDDNGMLVVTRVSSGRIPALGNILVDYSTLEPEVIHEADIIGGYSAGAYTGLEVVKQVYPKLRLVPGFILAPKWSQQPTVAARMAAIGNAELEGFKAIALVDLSTEPYEIVSYSDAASWKSDNGFNVENEIACWPKFKNGNDVYHLSTMVACIANLTDNANNGIPFASPSNKVITGTAAVLDDGTEVVLTKSQANSLNEQGIVTVLNGFNGWRVWGNRTAIYPGSTDPKDAFIPIRRMFNFFGNTVILTADRDIDEPGNKRQIEGVVGTVGTFINGLIAVGAVVDGSIQFLAADNSTIDLADGKVVFDCSISPPSPMEDLNFKVQYDPNALAALFA